MSYKKTTLPDYLDTIILQDVGFYKENTNLMEVFENYLEELQFNIDYEDVEACLRTVRYIINILVRKIIISNNNINYDYY